MRTVFFSKSDRAGRPRKRIGARWIAIACVLGAAGWLVAGAAAHHSDITASMSCTGSVSFVATAWAGTTSASRTNPDVRVYASTNGGASYVQVGAGAFNAANHYSFSGTFPAGSATSVIVKVQEVAKWADGAAPSTPQTATASRPRNCTSTTTTTTTTTTTSTTPSTPTTTTAPTTTATTTTTPTPRATTTAATPPATTTAATPPPATTTATTTPTGPFLPPSGTPPPSPGLTLVKLERVGTTGAFTTGPGQASVGQTVFYKLTVRNSGNTTLKVTVVDRRCDPGTLAPAGTITLASGATATVTCSHTLESGDTPLFTNTATATGTSVNAPTVRATASASVHVAVVAGSKKVRIAKVTKKAKPTTPVFTGASFTG